MYENIVRHLDQEIANLQIAKGLLTGKRGVTSIAAKNRKPPTSVPIRRGKHHMSPEGRERIAEAQRNGGHCIRRKRRSKAGISGRRPENAFLPLAKRRPDG